MMSAPMLRAQRRSSSSLSLIAGTDTATPGRLRPLLFETGPGTSTRVTTRGPSTAVTRTRTLPSSMRIGSPTRASFGRPLWVVETSSLVPSTSSVVMVNVSPTARSCLPSLNRPSRIFGPCRSTRTATERPDACAATRTLSYTFLWTSVSPWLRLSRATSIPASTRAWICSADSVAGPMVQTIFALRMKRAYAFRVFTVGPKVPAGHGGQRGRGPRSGGSGAQRHRAGGDRRGQLRAAREVGVDGGRGGATLGDGPHDQGLAAARVTRDEHAGDGGRV